MAVGRSTRLLAVAGAMGCLALLGGPGSAAAQPGRPVESEQWPTGSGNSGSASPEGAGNDSGNGIPLAIPGRSGAAPESAGPGPKAGFGPGTGSADPAPVDTAPPPESAPRSEPGDPGSGRQQSGGISQWQPLHIPGRASAMDSGTVREPATPASGAVADPVTPVGVGPTLGAILGTGSAALGSAALAPLAVTGSAAAGTGSAGLGAGSAAVGSAGVGVGVTGSAGVGTGSALLGTGSAAVGSAGAGVLGSGSAALGSAGVGVLGTGSAALGSAAVGSAAVGSAATGSAAVGSAAVGSAAPLLLLLLPVPTPPPPPVGPPLALPTPGGAGPAAPSVVNTVVGADLPAPTAAESPAPPSDAPPVVAAPPSHTVRPTSAQDLLPEPALLSVIGGLVALAIAGGGSAVMSYQSAAQVQARVDAARSEFFGTGA